MTRERRVLVDAGGKLAHLVDGLHDVVAAFGERRFAIVGGVAVLTHVQGHRVTEDIDSAVRGLAREVRKALLVVAEPNSAGEADALLANGVPVDLLVVAGEPRSGRGRGRQAKRREATSHALRWAIDTALVHEVVCDPLNPRGAVTVPVAQVSALLAMKAIALGDPSRERKSITDLLDLWLLLTRDVARADAALRHLGESPSVARRWAAEVLVDLLRENPERMVRKLAGGVGAPRSVADIDDIWEVVVQPHVSVLRR